MTADKHLTQQSKHRVCIERINDELPAALERGLRFLEWERLIGGASTVFLKPNLTFPRYMEGITTTPALVEAMLCLLSGRARRIIVGESDGGNNSFTADEAFIGHGLKDICARYGAELVNLSQLPSGIVRQKICGKTVEVRLPRLLLDEVDCFISLPVLKVHVMTTVTLSLKNSWGCIPDTMRCLRHQDLDRKLALIASLTKPGIIVIDGSYALDNHGPMYGRPVKSDLLITADNTVAADALGARLMGFDPARIGHIRMAAQAGCGSLDPDDLTINADYKQYVSNFTIRRTLIDRVSRLFFLSDALARLAMASPLTPIAYWMARRLRTASEKAVADQISNKNTMGVY